MPTPPSRPRPERADSPELAAFRRLKAEQPELAVAVDMQVEIVVLQHRAQARLSTPWLEFEDAWLARQMAEGAPIVRFDEVRFDWGELRLLFRQISDVLRRYDVVESADYEALQQLQRGGRPSRDDVAAWYTGAALRHRATIPEEPGLPEVLSQVLPLAARPFLARTVETLHQRVDLAGWSHPYCPFCGGDPELAILPVTGERKLACGRCTGIWPYDAHACPHCEDRRPGSQTSFASRDGHYRLIACDACRKYVKAYDARGSERPFMLDVDTIATLPLDAAAQQRGYSG
ncbi:MAG: formate dehydrogenase accessory protein FdhE [Acidobacteria bacterium]|nr:formate dehydrogenase accessory protein FdhE [Acidobacteriota bacterium]